MTISKSIQVMVIVLMMVIVATVIAQSDSDISTEAAMRVTGAWVRPGENTSAAYLQIHNDSRTDDKLIAVHLDTGTAEIHETQTENDVMRMRPVNAIDLPAGETVHLEPGGYHIMLTNFNGPLVEGDHLPVRLIFASGTEVTVQAFVSQTPIPYEIAPDALTEHAQASIRDGQYVGQVVTPPVQVQDFTAPGSDDELTRLSDTNGRWRVIFFGYMHCPDFCPLTLVDYRDVRSLLGEAADEVTFMFISVDSVRDTPEAVRQYLDHFDSAFVGFSPDDATLNRIQPDYGFYYQRRLDEGRQAVYTIDHSTRSYLLDRDGVLRASFAYDTDPQQMADALLWYLENE
ncbi:SCO family protein [Phototrophicus methaneseepsis]|uniref:SCO family protein n=1 Tax=Phototrophicus methaneseepsis TaxID=2710758 RepID=A0A7S8EB59_9CHLR|nr:copper chaperone PCu(A)C [Phototrophicus methaneseepsis]QPC83709.1 SCO family protein [Phototrophicus methaneseepsis]